MLSLGFEHAFGPEIEVFSPPQPVQRAASPTTPIATSRRKSLQTPDQSTLATSIATVVNGNKGDEASVVRPVSVAQRTNRLSILGGKKKPLDEPQSPQTPQSPLGRDAAHRASLFQLQSSDHDRNHSTDQLGLSQGHSVTVKGAASDEHSFDAEPAARKGSVRKRLSMLKLGVMKGKGNMMGSLDEE